MIHYQFDKSAPCEPFEGKVSTAIGTLGATIKDVVPIGFAERNGEIVVRAWATYTSKIEGLPEHNGSPCYTCLTISQLIAMASPKSTQRYLYRNILWYRESSRDW